ncbi:hypothetical protein Cpir12675_005054 [Ceratocystis pirilliformis]|uniref:Tubulin-specific chaperone D n=1 Tax=Ceratocystis pirilliformis TaxID=259994 RepID=A0ABR3YTK9_9PEZI
MDALYFEPDVWLQKASGELLADLRQSVPKLLRKPGTGVNGASKLRYRVRMQEVSRLDSLVLSEFLELPQLLDPHLPELVPQLATAYLEYLQTSGMQPCLRIKSHLIQPLPEAVAHLLYTFCKVRGEKVIVRFFNVETKYIELLLSAIEADFVKHQKEARDSFNGNLDHSFGHNEQRPWTWQERYIILLWLSQLLFAPFDLSTISSVDLEDLTIPEIPNFKWPPNLPSIAVRLIPMAIKYLEKPGKERDGARALLVRMSMRKDMQEMGVLNSLISWALKCLEPRADIPVQSAYYYDGRLSFLAGVLRASIGTSGMDSYLVPIFKTALDLTKGESGIARHLMASSVARKMIIKVMRSVTALYLRSDERNGNGASSEDTMELVEICITFLMERLADNETPVRLAASKALSIITLQLSPEMAEQVVEAVLEAMNQKVLWIEDAKDSTTTKTRDLSAVDPLEWHGLTLTLSHLLYRRSPPASQLSSIIHALILGLSFEQRGPSGASIGTNVRDAACFGIWAISRRYTTTELLAVPTQSFTGSDSICETHTDSVIQTLATELVVAASRDPASNIRRGASAALQELIGRHPDTVVEGISLVQSVDYSSVALRSRAIDQVSSNATRLSVVYGGALQHALLTWRGIGDADAAARRVAGKSFGTLTLEMARMRPVTAVKQFRRAMGLVAIEIEKLQARQAEERHGLLLCLAAILDQTSQLAALVSGQKDQEKTRELHDFVQEVLKTATAILKQVQLGSFRREELLAEAASRLSVSLLPVIQMALFSEEAHEAGLLLLPGHEVLLPQHPERVCAYVIVISDTCREERVTLEITAILSQVLPGWLEFDQQETADAVSLASLVYLILSSPAQRLPIIRIWADAIQKRHSSRIGHGYGYFYAMAISYPVTRRLTDPNNDITASVLLERWNADHDIDTHVAILHSLKWGDILRQNPHAFLDLLAEGLNNYTTNARGDVGSLVRVAALQAVESMWRGVDWMLGDSAAEKRTETKTAKHWLQRSVELLLPPVLRLAAEKLDRVRAEAHQTLTLALTKEHRGPFAYLTFSSQEYFFSLLNLLRVERLHPLVLKWAKADMQAWMAALMAGYVTSAEMGNEMLVTNSRAALVEFVSDGATRSQTNFLSPSNSSMAVADSNLDAVTTALVANIRAFQGIDRVLVPSLEITAFLMHVGLLQKSARVDARGLCLQAQKAGYKSGNIKKIEACVKIYGGLARMGLKGPGESNSGGGNGVEEDGGNSKWTNDSCAMGRSTEAVLEARRRLGALMFHPWPKVRNFLVDEIWSVVGEDSELAGQLLGVNWGTAGKEEIRGVVERLGLA